MSTGLQNLLIMSEIPQLMVSTVYRNNGNIVLRMRNVGAEARMISQNATLIQIDMLPQLVVTWETSIKDTQ